MPAPFQKRLERTSYDPDLFKAISGLSIQGSQYSGCSPRVTLQSLSQRKVSTSLDIAYLRRSYASSVQGGCTRTDLSLPHSFTASQEGDVFANVPVALIQEALDVLEGDVL